MAVESTTKSQVQAYRFGMRRLELAVATGRSFRRSGTGSRPGLSILVGLILAAVLVAAFAVYGLIRSAPTIGSATVLIDSDRGGAYVVRDGRLYPATNLASALLAAGAGSGSAGSKNAPERKSVNTSALAGLPKGQLIGINGAPNQLPGESDLVPNTWAVCDTTTVNSSAAASRPPTLSTTVVLGEPIITADRVPNVATLVSADQGQTSYLLWNGKRARLPDTSAARAVALALRLDGVAVRPISVGLLNAVPETTPLDTPDITGAGRSVSWSDLLVGTVFTVKLSSGVDTYVVLGDGVQRITPVYGDLIRASGNSAQPTLSLSDLDKAPVSTHPLVTSNFPAFVPTYAAVADSASICLTWTGTPAPSVSAYAVYPTRVLPLPAQVTVIPVPPVPLNAPKPLTADSVYIAPGHGAVFGQVNGNQPAAAGTLYLVTDQGLKYPVVSQQALVDLGLGKTIHSAPSSLLDLLPTGSPLDPATAAEFNTTGGR